MRTGLQPDISQLLEEANRFAQQGERERAYQSSLEASKMAPEDPMAWYLRSQAAPSPEEQLMCLSRAYALNPAFDDVKRDLRTSMRALLQREPFLAYVHETEQFYQVRSGLDLLINIPKNRTFDQPFLERTPGLATPAFRWLAASFVALLLGGVGAVLLAPLTAFQALRLRSLSPSPADRVRLWIVLFASLAIWIAAIPISWLLLIRFFTR